MALYKKKNKKNKLMIKVRFVIVNNANFKWKEKKIVETNQSDSLICEQLWNTVLFMIEKSVLGNTG